MPADQPISAEVSAITVACEGSDCPIHKRAQFMTLGVCSMCGEWVIGVGRDYDVAEPHERKDVLAMINRGDFDA